MASNQNSDFDNSEEKTFVCDVCSKKIAIKNANYPRGDRQDCHICDEWCCVECENCYDITGTCNQCGADWYYIGNKDPTYDGLGVLKLFTIGGCGFWWLADWIRIATSNCNFKDPNGVCLESW